MTGKTMEVPRDLAVDICNGLRITQERAVAELRELLDKTACIDCKETGFCLSIMGDEIRCPCHAPIQFAKPDEFQAEPAAQPQGDRLGAAAEFVQKLIDSAGSQPSIATGYLSDILDVLVGSEVDGNSQAPKPQGEPKPTGLSQGWNLTRKHDGFVVGHQSEAYHPDEKAIQRADSDGYVWVPFLLPAALPPAEHTAVGFLERMLKGSSDDRLEAWQGEMAMLLEHIAEQPPLTTFPGYPQVANDRKLPVLDDHDRSGQAYWADQAAQGKPYEQQLREACERNGIDPGLDE